VFSLRHSSRNWLGFGALYLLLGGVAGGMAVALLQLLPPLRAAIGVIGIGGAFFCIAVPHLGLYTLAALMIAVWPYQLIKLLGLVVTGAIGLWALKVRRPLLTRDAILLVQLLLTSVICISALRSTAPDARSIALGFVSYATLTWTMATASHSGLVVRRIVGAMLLSGVVIAVIGLVQYVRPFVWIVSAAQTYAESPYYDGGSLEDSLQLGGSFRVESLTGTPNFLGMSMQILLPFAVLWSIQQASLRNRALGLVMVALLATAMVLSFTRGVILTTAAIIVPLLALRIGLRRSLPWLVVSVLLAGVLMLLWDPLRARLVSTIEELLRARNQNEPLWSTAAGWRAATLPIAWEIFTDHFWTGVGLGNQRTMWRQYAPTFIVMPGTEVQLPVHNAYLQLAVDVGIGGIGLLIALVVVAWWQLRRAQSLFRARQQRDMFALACAAEIAWLAMTVNNVLYPGLDNYRYFWVLLAVIGAIVRVAADQRAAAARGIANAA